MTNEIAAERKQKLPKHIEVVAKGNHDFHVLIDGEEFPWYIAEEGVTVTPSAGRMPSVTIEIVADKVTVTNEI